MIMAGQYLPFICCVCRGQFMELKSYVIRQWQNICFVSSPNNDKVNLPELFVRGAPQWTLSFVVKDPVDEAY